VTFGAVVRDRRQSLGLTQVQLAHRAGCNRQSIVRVETAAHSPSLDRLFALADALEISLDDLFRDLDRRTVPP
jgi:transcriptional regulator with XRE-family HTH domain